MENLTDKISQFFRGEDFAEHGDDARLELTPAELRQISNLVTENVKLKTELDSIENEATLFCPKFKNQQEKRRVFHIIIAIAKCFTAIGNVYSENMNDVIDDIYVLKELVRKMEAMEEQDQNHIG